VLPSGKRRSSGKSPTGNVDTAIEGIKKRVESATNDSRPSTARGNSEINLKMRVYYSVVWSMIKEQWALPKSILPDDNLEAIVETNILRNGTVFQLDF